MFQHTAILLALVLTLSLTGCRPAAPPFECDDEIGCVTVAPDEPIQLGALQALSGDMAPQGHELLQVTQLALEDRGRELLGHPVELQIDDSQCSKEGGTTAAPKIAADPQIVGIVGPTCSGCGGQRDEGRVGGGPGHGLGLEHRAFPDLGRRETGAPTGSLASCAQPRTTR